MQFTNILAVAILLASSTVASPAADAHAPPFSSVKSTTTTTTTPTATRRHLPKPQKPQTVIPVKKCPGSGYDPYCCGTNPLSGQECVYLADGDPCSDDIYCCYANNSRDPCFGSN